MKIRWILFLVFMLADYSQVTAQPSSATGQGFGLPGIQEMVSLYGEQLNLTDDQISELIDLSLDRRGEMHRLRTRPDWRYRPSQRAVRTPDREHTERPRRHLDRDRCNRELMQFLTAAEYEKLQRMMFLRGHHRQPPFRRSPLRSR